MPISTAESSFKIDAKSLNGLMGELDTLPKRVRGGLTELNKYMATTMISRIMNRMPMRTGSTASHWIATTSGFSVRQYKKGSVRENVEAQIASVIDGLGPFDRFFLTNNDRHFKILNEGLFVPKDPGKSKDTYISPFTGRRKGRTWVKGGYSTATIKNGARGITHVVLRGMQVQFARTFSLRTLGVGEKDYGEKNIVVSQSGLTLGQTYGEMDIKTMYESFKKSRT